MTTKTETQNGADSLHRLVRTIELKHKVDAIKPGQWWVWECDVEMQDGTWKEGFIESDGEMHSMESLELS